jgi:hypothetical protein
LRINSELLWGSGPLTRSLVCARCHKR